MQVIVCKNKAEVAEVAATIFASTIYAKPNCVLGLATGSTPVPTYQKLIELHKRGLLDFSKVSSYNLDEYVGLAGDHKCSYRYFMNTELFDHVNIDKANTFVPNGLGDDPEANAKEYDAMLEKIGGVDLQILGIGHNGHIGFNEPRENDFVYGTNIVTLTQSTRDANAQYFDKPEDMPEKAISMGIGTIMTAKRVILLATGKGKAQAILDTVKGAVSPKCPASVLQLHQNCQIIVDEEAASLL
ncbi:MAG: glucosamine-6-phosphate deaminase [Eubacteriales bacterium]|nr:glucosamine-6-phosphate deaminase [Eubacteriales bacterium]